ncbi:MAG: DUF4846 domain-containing protein [Chitinophagaceae bacterium]
MRFQMIFSLLCLLPSCGLQSRDKIFNDVSKSRDYEKIGEIDVPEGFQRLDADENSFGNWLRNVHLRKDKRVFLYNGVLKKNQEAQFAVLNEKVGDKDLQQCADAIIRLRAEYFFSKKQYDSIHFKATDGTTMSFADWQHGKRYHLVGNRLSVSFNADHSDKTESNFENFLETVFRYAGTASLASELSPVSSIGELRPGDVFIKPGFPGHAMLIVDVCSNKSGKKLFMLAQSYMPAQDIHIVKNPMNEELSPWYEVNDNVNIYTPEWTFTIDQLKRWH